MGMTIDEAIKHAEEVAEEQEKAAKEWHENQVRKCELIPFAEMDYTHENECKECAAEHRQLAEWLRKYQKIEKIIEEWSVDNGAFAMSESYWLNLIRKEVENGNDN